VEVVAVVVLVVVGTHVPHRTGHCVLRIASLVGFEQRAASFCGHPSGSGLPLQVGVVVVLVDVVVTDVVQVLHSAGQSRRVGGPSNRDEHADELSSAQEGGSSTPLQRSINSVVVGVDVAVVVAVLVADVVILVVADVVGVEVCVVTVVIVDVTDVAVVVVCVVTVVMVVAVVVTQESHKTGHLVRRLSAVIPFRHKFA
jgi:hypothetical protein